MSYSTDWFWQLVGTRSVSAESPDLDALRTLGQQIQEAIQAGRCHVFSQGESSLTYRTGNSTIICGPPLTATKLLHPNRPHHAAINIVHIEGPANEEQHVHKSHVLAFVIHGHGVLLSEGDEAITTPVASGDLVVIPRGAFHIFECKPSETLIYIALEISDEVLDYQAHYASLEDD